MEASKASDFQSHLANTPFLRLCPNRSNTSNVWKLTVQKPCSQSVLKSTKEHCKPKPVFYAVNYIQYSSTPSQLHLLSAGLDTELALHMSVHPGASSPLGGLLPDSLTGEMRVDKRIPSPQPLISSCP